MGKVMFLKVSSWFSGVFRLIIHILNLFLIHCGFFFSLFLYVSSKVGFMIEMLHTLKKRALKERNGN